MPRCKLLVAVPSRRIISNMDPLLVYSLTRLAGSAGVTRSAGAYRFGGLYALRSPPAAESPRHFHFQDRSASLRLLVSGLMPVSAWARRGLPGDWRCAGTRHSVVA